MDLARWYLRRGRINRPTYWLHYVLPLAAASIVASILDDQVFGTQPFAAVANADGTVTYSGSLAGPATIVLLLAGAVPQVSSQVTRLHDRGHSAWWLLWNLLPIIGQVVLLVQTGFLPGDPRPNAYGPPPPAGAHTSAVPPGPGAGPPGGWGAGSPPPGAWGPGQQAPGAWGPGPGGSPQGQWGWPPAGRPGAEPPRGPEDDPRWGR